VNTRGTVAHARRLPGDVARWVSIARSRPGAGGVRVYYGRDRLPSRSEPAHGGAIKFQELADAFPNSPREFNLLYLGSSTMPDDARVLLHLSRRRKAAVAWNQNGVAYPGWYGGGYEKVNGPPGRILRAADFVLYQSEFCKLSADRFYGECGGPWEILHNPVDTRRFTPAGHPPERPTLLLGGNQYQSYRFDVALRTLRRLPDDWQLLVAGELSWYPDRARARREGARLIEERGVGGRVELVGPYTQAEAPALVRRAHVLLHTKYNDPCPTVVLEAMASGLPVVYSASGGVPELVGEEAGVGVQAPLDWERDHPPDPGELQGAVLQVAGRLGAYSAAARQRAVERFDLRPWVERHRVLFEELVG
jgi:glycosyltransferase involved in cell wall biosynthesis